MYLICKLTKQHDSCSNPLPEVCESLVAESAVIDSDPLSGRHLLFKLYCYFSLTFV